MPAASIESPMSMGVKRSNHQARLIIARVRRAMECQVLIVSDSDMGLGNSGAVVDRWRLLPGRLR